MKFKQERSEIVKFRYSEKATKIRNNPPLCFDAIEYTSKGIYKDRDRARCQKIYFFVIQMIKRKSEKLKKTSFYISI